jgi:hypothetical protein
MTPRTSQAVDPDLRVPQSLLAAVPMRETRHPCHARQHGFDLHAGVLVPGRDRARLERPCRYPLRPPIADDRLRLTESGEVLLALRHQWTDGTTHLLFDPLELLERHAALTPRPRINLVLYYGVLAAHVGWRSRTAVRRPAPASPEAEPEAEAPPVADPPDRTSPKGFARRRVGSTCSRAAGAAGAPG